MNPLLVVTVPEVELDEEVQVEVEVEEMGEEAEVVLVLVDSSSQQDKFSSLDQQLPVVVVVIPKNPKHINPSSSSKR